MDNDYLSQGIIRSMKQFEDYSLISIKDKQPTVIHTSLLESLIELWYRSSLRILDYNNFSSFAK